MTDGNSNIQTGNVYEHLLNLVDYKMDSEALQTCLSQLFPTHALQPDMKAYSDAVYLNYMDTGMSLKFLPDTGYRPSVSNIDGDKLRLESIDIYNSESTKRSGKRSFQTFSQLPLLIPAGVKPTTLTIAADTKGADFVSALGEPPRKGGGQGSLSGSIDIWCEWPKVGLLVEFSTSGPNAWEQGQHSMWKVLTIFRPSVEV